MGGHGPRDFLVVVHIRLGTQGEAYIHQKICQYQSDIAMDNRSNSLYFMRVSGWVAV